MIKAIQEVYGTNETEIITKLVQAEYEILLSDKRTYGDFKIK